MVGYTLRKMTSDDYMDVYRMKKNAFKRYVVENWGSWDAPVQREHFRQFVEIYRDCIYIIQVDGEDVGFYVGKIMNNGNFHIATIVIKPEHQGNGLGTKVLRDIISKNRKRNIDVKYFKTNPVGELYKRLGFVPYSETKYHYHVIKWGDDVLKYEDDRI
jgi:ribosomal protein S18 acetylase RimI-like enzyme